MRVIFLISQVLLLLLFAPALDAQSCGQSSVGQLAVPDYDLSQKVKKWKAKTSEQAVEFKVVFHYFNPTDKAVARRSIEKGLRLTNSLFLGARMQFAQAGSPHFIQNNRYHSMIKDQEGTVRQLYHRERVINIYCFPTLRRTDGASFPGYAPKPYPGSREDYIVLAHDAVETSTFAHELGHFFGLDHTHHNEGDELVRRVNCNQTGDNLCDTPADYDKLKYDTKKPRQKNIEEGPDGLCGYTGKRRDREGMLYRPMINNIMSYGPEACRNAFTTGQVREMRFHGAVSRSYLRHRRLRNFELRADFPVYSSLSEAFTNYGYTGKDKVVVVIYQRGAQYCERTMHELLNHRELMPYFDDSGNYNLVVLELDREDNTLLRRFLGNTVFALPQYQQEEAAALRTTWYQDIASFPAYFQLQLRPTDDAAPRLMDYHLGYLKPREVVDLLR